MIRVAAAGDLHCGADSGEWLREGFRFLAEHADVLLLAGDLTRLGTLEEAAVVAEGLRGTGVPTVAVLGNHDYQSECEVELTATLRSGGITVLEGDSTVIEVAGCRVGIAGVKGFGGGFLGVCATEFGEAEMKVFVRRASHDAARLAASLKALSADIVIALTHYAPTDATLDGEPLQIHPFLGCYQLGEAIDASAAVLAVHGHAHRGTEIGTTVGGVHVRNVALPVIRNAYRVYCIDPSGVLGAAQPFEVEGARV